MNDVSASRPCVTCAKPVFEDNRFCPNCGTPAVHVGKPRRAAIVREFASGAMRSAGDTALDLMKREKVQKVAGGAALGMGVAAVIPVVSLTAGAVAGAAFVGYKIMTRE